MRGVTRITASISYRISLGIPANVLLRVALNIQHCSNTRCSPEITIAPPTRFPYEFSSGKSPMVPNEILPGGLYEILANFPTEISTGILTQTIPPVI